MNYQQAGLLVAVLFSSMVLSACNGQEDFGDANIDGPIWGQQPSSPPTSTDRHVAVELVVGASVDGQNMSTAIVTGPGLNYECGNVREQVPEDGIARCWPSTSQVRYWFGPLENTTGAQEWTLGTYYLPMCTGRELEESGSTEACVGGTGSFQATLSEILPKRIDSSDSRHAPAHVEPNDPRVITRAALLNALDEDKTDSNTITIPAVVRGLVSVMPGSGNRQAEFEKGYSDFVGLPETGGWYDWMELVTRELNDLAPDPNTHNILSLFDPASFTPAKQTALVKVATDRVRAGFYAIEHDYLTYGLLSDGTYMALQMPFLVLPSGDVLGVGTFIGMSTNLDSQNPVKVQQIPLYLEEGTRLADDLRLVTEGSGDIWKASQVANSDVAELTFKGRIIGSVMYDGESSSEEGGNKTDYQLDYPESGSYSQPPYPLKTTDKGSFSGSAKVHLSNNTTKDLTFDDRPVRIGRTQYSSPYLHEATLDKLASVSGGTKYYRLDLYKGCSGAPEDNGLNCVAIPSPDQGVNYSEHLVLGGTENCDPANPTQADCTSRALTEHGKFATLNVEVLDDGTLVTLTDPTADCGVPATGSGTTLQRGATEERRIGYISRTVPSSEGPKESAYLALLIAGDESRALRGIEIQGRIDLSGGPGAAAPIRPLGDDSYEAGTNARWADYYSPHAYANSQDLIDVPRDEITGVPTNEDDKNKLYYYYTLNAGSVIGTRLDSITCQPVP